MVKAINFKNWCTENITPQSWPRIVLKSIPELRELGVDTSGLQEPNEDLTLNEPELAVLTKWLGELYQMKIEEEALIKI